MKRVLIGITLMLTSALAMAQLPTSDPAVVCGYLAAEQLGTQGWQVDEQQQGSCVSDPRGFGRDEVGPLHQLSYQAQGNATNATVLQVLLDVNPPQAMSSANQAFLQAAQRLSTEALGKRLPAAISSALTGGKEASARVGDAELQVTRHEHNGGQGYQMRLSIR